MVRKEYCKLSQWNEEQVEKFGDDWITKCTAEAVPHNKEQQMAADCPVHLRVMALPVSQAISMFLKCSLTTFPTILKFYFPPQGDIINIKAGKKQHKTKQPNTLDSLHKFTSEPR